jgi:hypothetical protein
MQPAELLVVHNQPKQFANVDHSVLAFVVAPLHIQQRLVEAQQRSSQRHEFFAGSGIIAFAMQRVW